jgi:hypothetical protein
MFNYIINFFKNNQTQNQSDIHIQKQPQPETSNDNQLFNQQYRIAYNKL